MVKKGMPNVFDMGEIDMIFGKSNLTISYPNRTRDVYDVTTTQGGSMTLTKDNATYNVAVNELTNLKHTIAMGLATYGEGKPVPDSFSSAMKSNMSLSMTMWKCQDTGIVKKCSFNSTIDQVSHHQLGFDPPPTQDACNKYNSCHPCINASTPGGIECGWCLGGTLNYDKIGNTTFKCGGFKAGQPYAFTCPAEFRTTDCSGFNCNWTSQKCNASESGQFPDMAACNKTCSIKTIYKKCNVTEKKCETCKMGTPGCNTGAFCEATCNKPHAKCNKTTG